MDEKLETLRQWIAESHNIVFFGGAGVSTESGIPDFRSVDGLYNQQYAYPPETIISHSFYVRYPEEFYRFYKDRMLFADAKPNAAHRALAKLEADGRLKAVITQNIDGLHQMAGSREVLELHGSVHRNYCTRCGKFYSLDDVIRSEGVPRCDCGGTVKPDVVLYEEGLDSNTLEKSVRYIRQADMLIIGGTSLVVYPAAGLIDYYRGSKLVLINKDATARDSQADQFRVIQVGSAQPGRNHGRVLGVHEFSDGIFRQRFIVKQASGIVLIPKPFQLIQAFDQSPVLRTLAQLFHFAEHAVMPHPAHRGHAAEADGQHVASPHHQVLRFHRTEHPRK